MSTDTSITTAIEGVETVPQAEGLSARRSGIGSRRVWKDQLMAAEYDSHGPEIALQQMRELASSAIASGQPLSWYETLYKSAAAGAVTVPWDHREPMPVLVEWLRGRYSDVKSRGSRAVVVGCGYGHDAEFIASLGFATTAFDISATAVQTARERHEPASVDYQQADLLAMPQRWLHRFDLVVESTTLQCLPRDLHDRAAAGVASLCAPGGTVLVISRQPSPSDPIGPPWLLTETEVRQVAVDGVELARLDAVSMNGGPRWIAEFRRPGSPSA